MKPTFEELLSLAEVCSTLPEFQDADTGLSDAAQVSHKYLCRWWPDYAPDVERLCEEFWWVSHYPRVAAFKKDLLEAYNDLLQTLEG